MWSAGLQWLLIPLDTLPESKPNHSTLDMSRRGSYVLLSIQGSMIVFIKIRHYKIVLERFDLVNITFEDLMRGLPNLMYKYDLLCDACHKGKKVKILSMSKNIVSTFRPLELLHIDQFGPTITTSISRKRYGLVVVNDYTRWT
ncbi:hypothetical protein CR513_47518, partial [Mucuna pruriens]